MNWLSDHELKQYVISGNYYKILSEAQTIALAEEVLAHREYVEKLRAILNLPEE